MKKLLLGILLSGLVSTVFAGGFQVNLQGLKQAAMGHTGTSLTEDGSVLFFNSAGMSSLKGPSVSINAFGILARSLYQESAPGTYSASTLPGLSTPFAAYAVWPFKLKSGRTFAAGIGIYTPFGSTVKYPDDWKGQFMLRELSLRTFFIHPSISYEVIPGLSVGAGFVYATGSVLLRRAAPVQFADESYGEALLKASGKGYGFSAGALYKHGSGFSVGMNFRSGLGFKADNGTAEFSVPESVADLFPSTSFSSNIQLPWTLATGFSYSPPGGKWTAALDINYIGWSVYDTLAFDFKDNTESLDDIASPREYKNAFIFRGGGSYQIHPLLMIRAGAYFDMTPVQDGYITPETPDANKIGISAGLSTNIPVKSLSIGIDAGFLWVEGTKRSSFNTETGFSGVFKVRAFIPGIGLNFTYAKPDQGS